ncbi:methionine adenosyltransferase, partial [Treponema sp. R6D11]
MCDQISDAVLDAILLHDQNARVACEVATTTGMVMVMGEITTECYVDIPAIVRKTVKKIGYDRAKFGFDADTCSVLTAIHEQSPDIDLGTNDKVGGAGDQGMMIGYACNQTKTLMPLPIYLAHELAKKLAEVRKDNTITYLRPDGKTQVSVEYEDNKPVRVNNIVVSAQHDDAVSKKQIEADIIEHVITPVVEEKYLDGTKFIVNPTGKFVVGGPMGDSGLTGRKIIVDTYGGWASHGGGAFSGKDPTKVDRSGAYMARYIAKNIVAAELASEATIQLAYAIGIPEPVSIMVDTNGTGRISDEQIAKKVKKVFDLTPKG